MAGAPALLSGLGAGWRPPLATALAERRDLGFVEVIAESVDPDRATPDALVALRVPVIPHGVGLSLGGAEPLDAARVGRFARVAEHLGAPLASEHVAFVRAGGMEAGHLLAVPRTRDALRVLTRNIRDLTAELSVPLALENPAALLRWPEDEMDEADFLTELADRTGVMLLLDLANLHGDVVNHCADADRFLTRIPWDRVAYLHVAGGVTAGGLYHDTHRHPVRPEVLSLLRTAAEHRAAAGRPAGPACMLERDGNYPTVVEFHAELDAISRAADLTAKRIDHHLRPPSQGGAPHTRDTSRAHLRIELAPPGAPRRSVPIPVPVPVPIAVPASLPLPVPTSLLEPVPMSIPDTVSDAFPDSDAVRDALRALGTEQVSLVRTLVAAGPPPAGFDPVRLAVTRATLIDKRRADLARSWPALADIPDFAAMFAAFAADRPPAGSHRDGLAFARSSYARLTVDARAELLAATTPRRRFAVRLSRPDHALDHSPDHTRRSVGGDRHGGTLLAFRLPLVGLRVLGRSARQDGVSRVGRRR